MWGGFDEMLTPVNGNSLLLNVPALNTTIGLAGGAPSTSENAAAVRGSSGHFHTLTNALVHTTSKPSAGDKLLASTGEPASNTCMQAPVDSAHRRAVLSLEVVQQTWELMLVDSTAPVWPSRTCKDVSDCTSQRIAAPALSPDTAMVPVGVIAQQVGRLVCPADRSENTGIISLT